MVSVHYQTTMNNRMDRMTAKRSRYRRDETREREGDTGKMRPGREREIQAREIQAR